MLTRTVAISRSIDNPPGSEKARNTPFLILPQPRLPRLAQDPSAQVIDQLADDDKHKGDGVHPMDVVMEDLDTDDHAPEVHGKHGDIEECRRRQAEEKRSQAVEKGQAQCVPDKVAADLAVPVSVAEGVMVEDAGLGAVDDHAEEGHLAEDFVDGAGADKVFFCGVGEAVEGCADQGEHVAFDLVAAGYVAVAGAGDLVGGDQDTHAADAREDADDLGDVVADFEEEEGYHDDDGDGPEVDQLRAEHGCVPVR